MGIRKHPTWITAQQDQRMAQIRDECDAAGIDLIDEAVGTVVHVLLACIETSLALGMVELYVEMGAWKELTK